ncbi:MAG: outer membrane beta-barrel protein, partial [Flavitalea sp.]
TAFAQVDTGFSAPAPAPTPKKWSTLNLNNRANDHFMIQLSVDNWANKTDTMKLTGVSRGFNMYLMYDMPFKTNPQFSVAGGVGVSTSNMYFEETYIDITGRNKTVLDFTDVSDTTNFKKYKLTTAYLEAPLELRWLSNPENSNRSWKVAVGGKIGTLISASTKGKTQESSTDQVVLNGTFKEKSKRFFNGTRMSATLRAGYGNFSLFGSYQINNFIKEGSGPNIRPYQIGLTLSGL